MPTPTPIPTTTPATDADARRDTRHDAMTPARRAAPPHAPLTAAEPPWMDLQVTDQKPYRVWSPGWRRPVVSFDGTPAYDPTNGIVSPGVIWIELPMRDDPEAP